MISSEPNRSGPRDVEDLTFDELRHRLAELSEAVAARDHFIAIAAHELRNPMTPMIGQIELLLADARAGKLGAAEMEKRLSRVHMLMNHYLKRATTLLDVSRITSGKLTIEKASCDLVEIVRRVAGAFTEAARHLGVTIEIRTPASLPGLWDPLALEQIIDNLVSNGIKYGGPNLLSIEVEGSGGGALLRVRDRGPGISLADRSRIFDRFERAVMSQQRQNGFGVGLWVAGQLVDAMGGEIAVDSAKEGGSVFTVILPYVAGPIGAAR